MVQDYTLIITLQLVLYHLKDIKKPLITNCNKGFYVHDERLLTLPWWQGVSKYIQHIFHYQCFAN
jgi:hypothetical protein